jgi:hypothetical protein
VAVPTAQPDRTLRTSAVSARRLREQFDTVGALVVGRRLFDLTSGWGGTHPLGVPVVVVTHKVPDGWPRADAPFTWSLTACRAGSRRRRESRAGRSSA